MEYWDTLEISEIEDINENRERRGSFGCYHLTDNNNFSLYNLIGSLSPYLSDDQNESSSKKSEEIAKSAEIITKPTNIDNSIKIGTLTYQERQSKLCKFKQKKKSRI